MSMGASMTVFSYPMECSAENESVFGDYQGARNFTMAFRSAGLRSRLATFPWQAHQIHSFQDVFCSIGSSCDKIFH